jgi:hypothetical protein
VLPLENRAAGMDGAEPCMSTARCSGDFARITSTELTSIGSAIALDLSALARVTLVLFRRRALGQQCAAEQGWGARVRKSRQKEAAGGADAVPMEIEWSEAEVLKLE